MSQAVRNRDIRAVEGFLAGRKALSAPTPEWVPSSRRGEMQAIWSIVEEDGTERAHLRFRCPISNRQFPSVSLIFRDNPVWRVDVVDVGECKYNPVWGERLGLSARVCGPHEHGWPDNRDYLARNPQWHLPARRPLAANLRRLPQIVPWLAQATRIDLAADQHDFDVPPQGALFPWLQ